MSVSTKVVSSALIHERGSLCAQDYVDDETVPDLRDDYEGEESRYAIYSVGTRKGAIRESHTRRRIAETSLGGIGVCLQALREDGDLTDNSRVGIFDRLDRFWLVNPWARGDLG